MSKPKPAKDEQLGLKLDAVLNVMRDLVILESAKGGLSRDQVRKMLGVSPARVSRIWKHLKKIVPKAKSEEKPRGKTRRSRR